MEEARARKIKRGSYENIKKVLPNRRFLRSMWYNVKKYAQFSFLFSKTVFGHNWKGKYGVRKLICR